ncbi:exopolysaccharide biosynthesis polyprenyl glycosylphosphotransferase [Sphingobium fluviale]|nr:exopolysaccharide biosynthesis polyprenyl glycosylphosphotransferase [Sphingobium fluviale]
MTDIRAVNGRMPRTHVRRALSKQAVRLILYVQLVLLDCATVITGFSLIGMIRGEQWISPAGVNIGYLLVPLYGLLAINRNAYTIDALGSLAESLRRSLTALFMTMLIILMFGFFFHAQDAVSRASFAAGICVSGLFLSVARIAFYYYTRNRTGERLTDDLLILDGLPYTGLYNGNVINAAAEQIEPDLQNPRMLSRLASYLHGFDRVVVACAPDRQYAWSLLLKGANIRGEIMLPESNTLGAIGLSAYHGNDTLVVSRGPLSMANRAKKRILDLIVTVPALILLSPLFLVVAIAIKLESKGPVFFRQQRIGRSNQLFNILKFRSMREEMCDAEGNRSAARDDDRITRVGAFIRRTSIDELPQLINVLRGDMSLVGPRPHALGSLAGDKLFWEIDEQYWVRHALKPGITGLAQIRGYRGATMQREDLENRLSADLEYVHGWRLWRDISILFYTAKVMIHRNAF